MGPGLNWNRNGSRLSVYQLSPTLGQTFDHVTDAEMEQARIGTVQDGDVVYAIDGETYRIPLKTIRGDYHLPDGSTGNRLRRWEKDDFVPRPQDIFHDRLYCIQWITKETLHKSRQETFFATVTQEDLDRERRTQSADWVLFEEHIPTQPASRRSFRAEQRAPS